MSRKMKDSGIEWIGYIPDEWKIVSLSKIAKIQTGSTPTKSNQEQFYSDEFGIPWIKAEDLGTGVSINNTSEFLTPYGCDKGRVFPPNTVYICCIASVGKVGYSCIECSCNQQINALIFNDLYYWKFGYYVSLSQEMEYINNSSGNVMKIINSDKQGRIKCPLPPVSEQQKIAYYLDDKCKEIDNIISKTQASIEEYKKIKQSIITQAVTKGVRGDREMKDSGIEWIGTVPDSWGVVKGHRIITGTQNGLTRRDLSESKGNIVLKLKNIKDDGSLSYDEVNRIELNDQEIIRYKLNDGDFLFVRVNGSKNLVGKCSIFKDMGEIVGFNDHIIRVRFNDLCSKQFLKYYLLSEIGKIEIDIHTNTAAGQYTISGDGLRDLRFIIPPKNEQIEIADYLNEKCEIIDNMIHNKDAIIKELEVYKKSLIYEYITGKKEVV